MPVHLFFTNSSVYLLSFRSHRVFQCAVFLYGSYFLSYSCWRIALKQREEKEAAATAAAAKAWRNAQNGWTGDA